MLLQAVKVLEKIKLEGDEQVGLNIVKRALEEPLRQIVKNAGKEGAEVISRLKREKNSNIGYNAKTDVYEDLLQAGVIDPTKVVRCGLQNASSIAAMILTTEALLTDFDEEKDKESPVIVV